MDVEEETSLMDDLAAAWENEESEVEEDAFEQPEPEFTDEPRLEEPQAVDEQEPVENVAPVENEAPESDINVAPKGLSPAAREAWANTPEPVRAEIAKREKDFENGIQKYAQQARRAQAMDQALAPYSNLFAMNGGPGNTLPGLLQTANSLQTGSEYVRAQTVASLIQQFGVPIATLADILEGKGAEQPQRTQQPDIQAEIQKALQPLYQQQTMSKQAAIQSEIQQFASDPANEFYADVRGDMADIMDIAAKQGKPMTMKEAYQKACMLRDDVRNIIQSREATGQVGARRNAASSISGAPRGMESGPKPESVADYLNQAWDMVGKRR